MPKSKRPVTMTDSPLRSANSGPLPDQSPRSVTRLPETGFLRQPQVLSFVPISRSTLWRRVQDGTFPEPVKLSARITAWRAEDVRTWIAAQGGD